MLWSGSMRCRDRLDGHPWVAERNVCVASSREWRAAAALRGVRGQQILEDLPPDKTCLSFRIQRARAGVVAIASNPLVDLGDLWRTPAAKRKARGAAAINIGCCPTMVPHQPSPTALIAQRSYGADADRHDVFAKLADCHFPHCTWYLGSADAAPFGELPGLAPRNEASGGANQVMGVSGVHRPGIEPQASSGPPEPEIEIVSEHREVGSRFLDLLQREAVFFWHRHGMPEEGCPVVRAPLISVRDVTGNSIWRTR